jgi:hypothetical protein
MRILAREWKPLSQRLSSESISNAIESISVYTTQGTITYRLNIISRSLSPSGELELYVEVPCIPPLPSRSTK